MSSIFVDTSAWFSVYDKRDGHHLRTSAFLARHNGSFVTTNLVFAETLSLITKRVGKPQAMDFGKKLRSSPRVRIMHIDTALEDKAWLYFERFEDNTWDLIDCASFALMDGLGLDTAFTLDEHFRQKGFRIVP